MSDDPKIAGMGMLDLVDEVQRVRVQRDELRAEVELLREERDTEAGIRIRAVERMVLYREALERIAEHGRKVRVNEGGIYDVTGSKMRDIARAALAQEDEK